MHSSVPQQKPTLKCLDEGVSLMAPIHKQIIFREPTETKLIVMESSWSKCIYDEKKHKYFVGIEMQNRICFNAHKSHPNKNIKSEIHLICNRLFISVKAKSCEIFYLYSLSIVCCCWTFDDVPARVRRNDIRHTETDFANSLVNLKSKVHYAQYTDYYPFLDVNLLRSLISFWTSIRICVIQSTDLK